ncbi:hypothetical protein [uncultured Sphingomonas sp.]|uniref:hypothetical protein n=1 Tax=uncultured Sphingomonas sp. TaxID=158754 RepID=UPI0035CB1942
MSVPTALAIFIGFCALAWASLGVDRTLLMSQVRTAYGSRDLRTDGGALFGNVNIGEHQYNDCLILFQTIDDRASRMERAISPLRPVPDKQGICADLKELVTSGPGQPPDFYHRYFHAQTTLARMLVPGLGVAGLRDLYKLLISSILVAGIGLALLDIARRRRDVMGVVWLIVFFVFARFFGLESFGQSLGHAPADLLIVCFLLIVSRASSERPISRRFAMVAAASFGALTIEFEFLTGGLPLGLAVVIGTLPLALAPGGKALKTTLDAAISFGIGVVTCMIGRILLLLMVFGTTPLTASFDQLLYRTGIGNSVNNDASSGLGSFVMRVCSGLGSLAAGMIWLVIGMLGLALVSGIWSYQILRKDENDAVRQRAVALVASNVVLLLWIVLFRQHTAEHAWFIDRIFVWALASSGILFALAVESRRFTTKAPFS